MQLSIANVISVSVSAAQTGLGNYNTSNLALFTNDAPAMSFGSLGYQLYLDPTQVATDFGSSSETFAMANSVFSQQPNILAGNGYLAVIPFLPNIQTLTFSGVAASGNFVLNYDAQNITVAWNETAAAIQTALQALTGLSQVTVTGSIASESLVITMYGIHAPSALTTSSNTLATSAPASITITVTQTQAAETQAAAVTRTQGLVQYFGIMADSILGGAEILAAAAVVQPLNKIMFVVSQTEADIEPGGTIDLLRVDQDTQTRGLYYGGGSDPLVMLSAYAGRALSVNFSGSNTTSNMHLKDLIGVEADTTMTQSILTLAQAAGADCYVSIQGIAKVFSSGANSFFDQVYNLQAFVGAIQIAGFNYLAESSTKVPQTEQGINGLKGAYRAICSQYVNNQYIAPGQWNSSTTFGNQVDFLNNISSLGYYIYSQPVSQQSQVDRAARQAPLIQIALKSAGAVNSSDVIVYVNN